MKHHLHALALALPFTLGACAGFGQGRAPVTPQRPTLSSDTTTTAAGTVEVEAGLVLDPGDRADTPTTIKWGASDQTEMLLGWSPLVNIDGGGGGGQDLNGTSDLLVGVRHRFAEETDDTPSAAFQLATKLPTANIEISSGEQDFFAAASLGKKIDDIHYTAFYQLGVLGNPAGRGADLGHDLALAATYGLNERWSLYGELAGQFVPDLNVDSIYLSGGAALLAKDDIVYDAGFVIGVTDDAPDFAFTIGVTHNLGRLFGAGK